MGMRATIARVIGLSAGLFLFHISVSMGPGPIALTVMFLSASSSAQVRVIAASPALAAVYDDVKARPNMARLVMLTMRPKRASAMAGSAACAHWIAARKL